jgi:Zn-finger nucleic acid-binding protein
MDCPVCKSVKLVMSERQGIEIDYCPQCRGIWLDRGELDKLIDRSAQTEPAAPLRTQQHTSSATAHTSHEEKPHWRHHDDDRRRYQDDEHRYREESYHKKRRGGFLGDLFDFD